MSQQRFQPKLHVKKGDTVVVIAGASKGTQGEVVRVFPETGKAIVSNVNVVKRHMKPVADNPGGIIEKEMPIHISNIQLVDPKTGKPTRIGRRVENGKLVRYSKKSNTTIK